MKKLVKSYGFWTALAGAVVVLVQALGKLFGFSIAEEVVSNLIMSIAGILVVFGVVVIPKEDVLDEDDSNSDTKDKWKWKNRTFKVRFF